MPSNTKALPSNQIADALRAYAIRLEQCSTVRLRSIRVDDLQELVLTIADILDRPLPTDATERKATA
ncbi:MAG: hypothetical protein SGI77_22870 [Pirellulaceae bacterium]|nr:hypothetical protein [Pirellulaceae bacterium]